MPMTPPEPLTHAEVAGLLRFLHVPAADDDTQPCAVTDAATEALAGMEAPPTWVRDMAALDGYAPPETAPYWTTVDALGSELEQVEFSTVARDGTVTVIATYPAGTPVMVTIMRVGGR